MSDPLRFRLVRGRVIGKLDTLMSNPTQQMLEALGKAEVQLEQISEGHGVTTAGERPHVLSDMLGTDWWPQPADKQRYFIAAYRKALELSLLENGALQPAVSPRPIRTLWIRGHEDFGMSIRETEHEITVFWITPKPPEMPVPAWTQGQSQQEAIWEVAASAEVEAVAAEFDAAGYPGLTPVQQYDNAPGVSIFQLVHY